MIQGTSFIFACPVCQTTLSELNPGELRCPQDGRVYCQVDGIWRFLPPEKIEKYSRFIHEYEIVRAGEGRGSHSSAFYRSLPYRDLSGRFTADWKIRAQSYITFLEWVIEPLERQAGHPLRILDLGAGNGWLSYQLSRRKHILAAVDILTNAQDGLGAYIHYDLPFTPIQAEFDALPFANNQAEVVVFNASLHYSTHYEETLRESQRVLSSTGKLVIFDSPVYSDPRSGDEMVHEREEGFRRSYGFASNAMPSENFLSFNRLKELGKKLGVQWKLVSPNYGFRWVVRTWKARLLARREPAKFRLIIGTHK